MSYEEYNRLAYVTVTVECMQSLAPTIEPPTLSYVGYCGLTDDVLSYFNEVHEALRFPDDIHIIGMHYCIFTRCWYLVLTGDGLPRHEAASMMPHYAVTLMQTEDGHARVSSMKVAVERNA